jgi:CubicO group peptidase (beta-lactamase class C family)
MRQFWTRDTSVPESSWALGWDTPTLGSSSSGATFSPNSVGHLGYTGTSIWYDPERDLLVVLLSNRVHPDRNNEAIRDFRPHIHDLIAEAVK